MKTTLIAVLCCAANMFLPCARAQQNEADRQALAGLRTRAGKGDAKAQFNLGDCYRTGEGVSYVLDYLDERRQKRAVAADATVTVGASHGGRLAEPSAPPNGGPAMRLEKSGGTEGPPSVSCIVRPKHVAPK